MIDTDTAATITGLVLTGLFTVAHKIDRSAEAREKEARAHYTTRRVSCLRFYLDSSMRHVIACPACVHHESTRGAHLFTLTVARDIDEHNVCSFCARTSESILND